MDGVTIRLTDAHVAAIADSVNEGRVVVALAKEVREARQRRCDGCTAYSSDGDGTWGMCERHAPNSAHAFIVTPDWFCADFAVLDSRAVADGH